MKSPSTSKPFSRARAFTLVELLDQCHRTRGAAAAIFHLANAMTAVPRTVVSHEILPF